MYFKMRGIARGALLVFVLLVLFFVFDVSAITVTTYNNFKVGNETYTFSHNMIFHTIIVGDSYIIFNETGFYVASDNAITITLVYINDDITNAVDGEKVLEFYADTTAGSVVFDLSGFPAGNQYIVNRSGVPIDISTADGSGVISFVNSVWNDYLFEIFKWGGGTGNNMPVVGDIPNQNIFEGASFAQIDLDSYVFDFEDPDEDIIWTYAGDTDISVSIDAGRVATISYPAGWIGAETITFTATDTDGLADSDYATFTVEVDNSPPPPQPPNPPPPSPPPYEPPPSGPGGDGGDNNAPVTPIIVSGPTFVEMGVEYGYVLSTSDPEGDGIRYRMDWDDGAVGDWSDFVASGMSVLLSHSWNVVGTYNLSVVAQDEHGLSTGWVFVFDVMVSGVDDSGSPPVVDFNVSGDLFANGSLLFDASGIFDLDGVASYFWDFGDGTNGSGVSVVHVYSQPGTYTVVLVVTDEDGNTYSKSIDVTVSAPFDEQDLQGKQFLPDISFNSIILVIVSAGASFLILFFRKPIKSFLLNNIPSLFSELKLSYSRYEIKRLAAKKEKLRVKTYDLRSKLDHRAIAKPVPVKPHTRFHSRVSDVASSLIVLFRKTIRSFVSDYVVFLFSRVKSSYSRYEIKRLAARKEKPCVKADEIHARLDRITVVKPVPVKPSTRFYSKMQEDSLKAGRSVVSDWKSLSGEIDRVCTGMNIDKLVKTEMAEAKPYVKLGSSFEDVNVMVDRLLSPADSRKVAVRSSVFYSSRDHVEKAVDDLFMKKMREAIDNI